MNALERLVLRWLAAVAPFGWSDTMLGDLREDAAGAAGPQRLWTIGHIAILACRFTTEAAWRGVRRLGRPRGTVLASFRIALRSLARSPAFSAVTILTLALAIGATTAIYSALRSFILHPLPFKDGGRYVFLWHKNPEMGDVLISPPSKAVAHWRTATPVFESFETFTGRTFVVTDGGEPEEITATVLQPSTLDAFGVPPERGRSFVATDSDPASPPVALISHQLWTRRFGSDPDLTRRTITLSGTPYAIVGVMPPRFEVPLGSAALWIPARASAIEDGGQYTIAKLRTGVTPAQAQGVLTAMAATETDPDLKGWSGFVMTPGDRTGTAVKTALFVLSGAAGLLLLIACANVASLVLARHRGRRRELAVRHALGASRGRIVTDLLVESGLLAVAGGAGGLFVANGVVAAMAAMRPLSLSQLDRVAIDPAAFMFAATISLAAAVLFGVTPAIVESRARLQDVLTSGGRAATSSNQRLRVALTVAQIAVALILVVGATLLLRSYARLSAVSPGFDPNGVIALKISLPADRYPVKDKARRNAFFEDLVAAVRTLPGVVSAAAGNGVPPDNGVMIGNLEVDGRPNLNRTAGLFSGGYVTPAYFSTLRIPIVEGRAFQDDDASGRDAVAIVGQTLATQFWPGQSAIGARVRIQSVNGWATVVGVAADVKAMSLADDSGRLQLYFPRAQTQPGFGAVIVRATGDPAALIPAMKAKVWELDPRLPVRDIATADQLKSRATSQTRFNFALLVTFAGCGLVLAVVGVYGVMALLVGQRRRELGIRMALGATAAAVGRLVMRQTALIIGLGLLTGTAGAALLSRYLTRMLYGTAPTDGVSYIIAAVALGAAAIAATIVPLRRATSVDPTIVLRSE